MVNYKAFSDSWVVTLPAHGGLLSTDLLIPQLCQTDAACVALSQGALVGNCSVLEALLGEAGWENDNVASGALADPCSTLATTGDYADLQRSVQDVCVEPSCAHVLQPLGLEVLGSGEAQLVRFDRDPGNATELLARVIAVTVLGREPELTLAVSAHTFAVVLERPGLQAVTVGLEHECARRGLRAPPLSTMDLFLNDNGALVCNWNCRPDHVRAQWNLEPLPTNLSGVDPQEHLCWPLPPDFVAVLFSVHIGTTLRAPHASLLPKAFYDDVNELADIIQTDTFPAGMVLLNIPRSSFDSVKFPALLADAAKSMGGVYEVLALESPLEVAARRLLSLGSEQGTLVAEGVAINPRTTLSPAAYVKETREAVQAVRNRLPPSIVDVGSVSVQELHRLATVAAPPPADAPARSRGRSAALGLELVFALVAGVFALIAALGRKRTWRVREGAWRREDERTETFLR